MTNACKHATARRRVMTTDEEQPERQAQPHGLTHIESVGCHGLHNFAQLLWRLFSEQEGVLDVPFRITHETRLPRHEVLR